MSLVIDSIANLPIGIKHGVGGVLGRKIYIGLGSAGRQLFFFDLDRPSKGWQSAPEFPGCPRDDAAFTVSNHKLYVFSGAGIEAGKNIPSVLLDSYVFDCDTNTWSQLGGDVPVGLLGASCCSLDTGEIVFFGGYRKETFDNFVLEIAEINYLEEPEKHRQVLTEFMTRRVEDYGWNQDIWRYSPTHNRWAVAGRNSFHANCGSAISKEGNTITLIEGEMKPGLRSLDTKQFEFDGDLITKSVLCAAICDVDYEHEGLAGHFSASINKDIYVYGGAYFIGSQSNFKEGKLYAHKGLTKHYTNKIWKYDGSNWHFSGEFGDGLAYGLCVSIDQRMYIIGGENSLGEAQTRCYNLSLQ